MAHRDNSLIHLTFGPSFELTASLSEPGLGNPGSRPVEEITFDAVLTDAEVELLEDLLS